MTEEVFVNSLSSYCEDDIFDSIPDEIFANLSHIRSVVIKPNWVKHSHQTKTNDWDYVISHPSLITAVLRKVLDHCQKLKKITITDGPQTDSDFTKILSLNPVNEWYDLVQKKGIKLEIIDLRDDEWISRDGIVTERKKLPGDPAGKILYNLMGELSEFRGQVKSNRGYYGADYNIEEANQAHNGINNLYSVSRTVIEADVFINLPKLKTHKKAGITACLKNLVGINTYKNFLPHHMEGSPNEGGDQFPTSNVQARVEGPIMASLKQNILSNSVAAKFFRPAKKIGELIFGKTEYTIRSGNWYGNDTIWRTILDLNKILLYGNPDGTMRIPLSKNTKKYIGIVDAILAGEGNGPLEPDPIKMGKIICGTNPVAIDAVCAQLMNFNFRKIPSIIKSFEAKGYPLTDFSPEDIKIIYESGFFGLDSIPFELISHFRPHFGWKGHIENFI